MSKTQRGHVLSVQESGEQSQAQWLSVYEAIAERWPQIDQGDLKQGDRTAFASSGFVTQQFDAEKKELEAAVDSATQSFASALSTLFIRMGRFGVRRGFRK